MNSAEKAASHLRRALGHHGGKGMCSGCFYRPLFDAIQGGIIGLIVGVILSIAGFVLFLLLTP